MTQPRITQLTTLLVTGTDIRAYLQGQLTADIDELDASRTMLATCNSAQGRVQAILWMVERSDGIAMILPASMIESTAARLRKYVLRSRVKIEAGTLEVRVLDALPGALVDAAQAPAATVDAAGWQGTGDPGGTTPAHTIEHGLGTHLTGAHIEHEGVSYLRLPFLASWLQLARVPGATPDAGAAETDEGLPAQRAWMLDYLRAGLPQVYPQTHEAFVAQMLNLDLLGGISFSKGCYTGQEIIARAHYRGAIKRRMFRFHAACPPPEPRTRILADGSHAGDVVDAVAHEAGCELLAVISLAQREHTLRLETAPDIDLSPLALPYYVS